MKPVALVNEPNIGHPEAKFLHREHMAHKWCWRWRSLGDKEKYREPLFVQINRRGPIRCELCGRRAGRILRKLILRNCETQTYDEKHTGLEGIGTVTYYLYQRDDLDNKGLKGWALAKRLKEELL
jgi:hypothetical protein